MQLIIFSWLILHNYFLITWGFRLTFLAQNLLNFRSSSRKFRDAHCKLSCKTNVHIGLTPVTDYRLSFTSVDKKTKDQVQTVRISNSFHHRKENLWTTTVLHQDGAAASFKLTFIDCKLTLLYLLIWSYSIFVCDGLLVPRLYFSISATEIELYWY